MRKSAIALAVIAAIGVPAARATPESWWLVSTKNWTCLSAPEAEFMAKTPDGSPRAMEQTIYQKDGSVTPLFWFAARVDCERTAPGRPIAAPMSWLAMSVAIGGVLLGLIGAKLIDFADQRRRIDR